MVIAPRATFANRFLAFVSDLALLALFLVVGVAGLNILVQLIVLVVGIFEHAQRTNLMVQLAEQAGEPSRVRRDVVDLLWAIGHVVIAGGAYWGALWLRRQYMHLFASTSFESFVSKRYLLAREGGRLVSLISIVSVLGVAVGVMALIVVISVMEGFDRALVKKFMGVFSHIEILPDPTYTKTTQIPPQVYLQLMEDLERHPSVVGVAPLLGHQTLIQATGGADQAKEFVIFRGVDPEREKNVTDFLSYIQVGSATPGDREIVLGSEVARRLRVQPGDEILAIGKVAATANRTAPKTVTLTVSGIFQSGLYDVDERFVYTNIPTLQRLLLLEDTITSVHLKIEDPKQAYYVSRELLPKLPFGYGVRTWQDINPTFFEALWIEKVAMFIILLLIVLVAALNIIGTLVMTVVQKTRDIGILKSMGAERFSIMKVFLYHGFLVGLLGTSLGTAWGLRLCRFVDQDIEKIFKLPPGVYGLNKLPVVVEPGLIGLMAGSALTICVLAAIIPAWQASRLNPVEALRYDG